MNNPRFGVLSTQLGKSLKPARRGEERKVGCLCWINEIEVGNRRRYDFVEGTDILRQRTDLVTGRLNTLATNFRPLSQVTVAQQFKVYCTKRGMRSSTPLVTAGHGKHRSVLAFRFDNLFLRASHAQLTGRGGSGGGLFCASVPGKD